MNIHRKSKSGCEPSINHYKNVSKDPSFSIQILEKLEGNGFINGQRDFAVQKLRLQREYYWMKKLCTIYPYCFNERAKHSNLKQPTGKLFLPLPKYRHENSHENLEKRRVNEATKFDITETLLDCIATFPPKKRSGKFLRILDGMKGKDLRKLTSNVTEGLQTCDDGKKRWYELIIDIFLPECLTLFRMGLSGLLRNGRRRQKLF